MNRLPTKKFAAMAAPRIAARSAKAATCMPASCIDTGGTACRFRQAGQHPIGTHRT